MTTRPAYVAVVDGAVVGAASLNGSVIRSIYVDPAHQGKGIGAQLMDVSEGLAREQSVAIPLRAVVHYGGGLLSKARLCLHS
ncbi:MAG TPA: GNAT family N-acetyltransferase [Xanthobacteraceae bacterium]|nr:GNAT family N-acetyltransferase [Xanthobacteraceae bacterium]